jgi:hypothetical protein
MKYSAPSAKPFSRTKEEIPKRCRRSVIFSSGMEAIMWNLVEILYREYCLLYRKHCQARLRGMRKLLAETK